MTRQKASESALMVARIRADEQGGPSAMADRIEGVVREPLAIPPVRTVGGELVPDEDFVRDTLPALVDTLTNPDGIGSEASRARLELASQAGSVGLALDAADTIQANDSLERMLAHQMATAHTMAMRAAVVMGHHLECAEKYLDPPRRPRPALRQTGWLAPSPGSAAPTRPG